MAGAAGTPPSGKVESACPAVKSPGRPPFPSCAHPAAPSCPGGAHSCSLSLAGCPHKPRHRPTPSTLDDETGLAEALRGSGGRTGRGHIGWPFPLRRWANRPWTRAAGSAPHLPGVPRPLCHPLPQGLLPPLPVTVTHVLRNQASAHLWKNQGPSR